MMHVFEGLDFKWYVSNGDHTYLRDDMTTHNHMTCGGGTYFTKREDAKSLADRWNATQRAPDDTPKLWRDMTDEEKGALLLACHNGKVIEYWDGIAWRRLNWFPSWDDDISYRVKPEPVREVVGLYGALNGDTWVFGNNAQFEFDTHRITFETVDGKPDCSSIKMEEL